MKSVRGQAPPRRQSCGGRSIITALLALVFSLGAGPAWAHGGSTSTPHAVTVDLGELQVRMVVGAVDRVPGTVLIDLSLMSRPEAPLEAEVRAWPSTSSRPEGAEASVRILPGDVGPYPTQIEVDRVGPWDIELRMPGDVEPVSMVRIPITVVAPPGDPEGLARSIAFAIAGGIALAGVATAVVLRPRSPRISSAALRLTVPATVTALAVAVAVAVTLSIAPLGSTMRIASITVPHVNVSVESITGDPVVGTGSTLQFILTDGSTGRPVDDLTPHHEALLHVVIVGKSPLDFAHVHPARVEPGRYLLEWTPLAPGDHDVQIELVRRASVGAEEVSSQVVQKTLEVDGGDVAGTQKSDPLTGLGSRQLDGLEIDVTATGPLTVGSPIGIAVEVTAAGMPVQLDPWLGMRGHLILSHRTEGLFSHLHAAGPMSSQPTLAGTREYEGDPLLATARRHQSAASVGLSTVYTPPVAAIDFAYNFPVDGVYTAWVQFRHADRIVTVPLELEVGR